MRVCAWHRSIAPPAAGDKSGWRRLVNAATRAPFPANAARRLRQAPGAVTSGECSRLITWSAAVIQLQLHRVRRHAEARDLLLLQAHVRVDDVVGEHAAAREELAILVEVLERQVERVAHGGHVLR